MPRGQRAVYSANRPQVRILVPLSRTLSMIADTIRSRLDDDDDDASSPPLDMSPPGPSQPHGSNSTLAGPPRGPGSMTINVPLPGNSISVGNSDDSGNTIMASPSGERGNMTINVPLPGNSISVGDGDTTFNDGSDPPANRRTRSPTPAHTTNSSSSQTDSPVDGPRSSGPCNVSTRMSSSSDEIIIDNNFDSADTVHQHIGPFGVCTAVTASSTADDSTTQRMMNEWVSALRKMTSSCSGPSTADAGGDNTNNTTSNTITNTMIVNSSPAHSTSNTMIQAMGSSEGGNNTTIVTNSSGQSEEDNSAAFPSVSAYRRILGLVDKYTVRHFSRQIQIPSTLCNILTKSIGYHTTCTLEEPHLLTSSGRIVAQGLKPHTKLHPLHALTIRYVHTMVNNAATVLGQHVAILDVERLHGFVRHLFPSQDLDEILTFFENFDNKLPPDNLALLFATLTVGTLHKSSFTEGTFELATTFFEQSTQYTNDYTGPPTFDTVLTLFFHHIYLLHVGATDRVRAVINRAIQVAHDLDFNGKCPETPNIGRLNEVHVYLLLCNVDLYCAMCFTTTLRISKKEYPSHLFEPLLESRPSLRTVVDLIMRNGSVVENLDIIQSYDRKAEMHRLETSIGRVFANAGPVKRPVTPEAAVDAMARGHFSWVRLCLAASFLPSESRWVQSINTCVRSAQMILETYFTFVEPVVTATVLHFQQSDPPPEGPVTLAALSSVPSSSVMPSTWRQVQRIVTSSLVMFYAYWHGECSEAEVTRFTAMALLLLERHEARWEEALDGARGLIQDLTVLCDIHVERVVQTLFPSANTNGGCMLLATMFRRSVREQPLKSWRTEAARDEAMVAVDVAAANHNSCTLVICPRASRMPWQPSQWKVQPDDRGFLAAIFTSSTDLGLVGAMPMYRIRDFWM
ncbi:hypothetical protein PV08_07010 [Exophiala spinifera]|uniref:Transcription factor domain-containing protein n=1 Tax=Exophiala spinifera TaxID=91928 RepID=A0A0D2B5L6_9EURO|nr:uncharacterized protein PV08_07010 [Exophiala spinifera]KIW14228.1 hypothetical protein PV08_07010 [Exophiala spinifera]